MGMPLSTVGKCWFWLQQKFCRCPKNTEWCDSNATTISSTSWWDTWLIGRLTNLRLRCVYGLQLFQANKTKTCLSVVTWHKEDDCVLSPLVWPLSVHLSLTVSWRCEGSVAFTVSVFTWHSRKPDYCVSPTMMGSLRRMYTPYSD